MSRPHPSSQRGLARIVHRAPDLPASFSGAVLGFAPAKVEEFAEMIEGLGFDDLVEGGWDGEEGWGAVKAALREKYGVSATDR